MPRVSLVGNGHGGAEDYATGDLWWAAESGVDYGSQIEAVCKGDCGGLDATGATPYGYSIDSDGVDYDGTNHLDLPVFINLYLNSENGTARNFNVFQSSIFTGVSLGANNTLAENFHVSFGSGSTGFALNMLASATNRSVNNFVLDCTNTTRAQAVYVGYKRIFDATNYVIFGAEIGCPGSAGNQNYINGFSFNNSNIDYEGDAELTNAASEDTTGSVGWTGYTSAELVNFAGGDFRTKSTSDLADDGAGGFIGAFLEAGGGNDVILDVDNGAFSLSGSDVLFMASRIEQALTGNYNLSGSDINFSIGYAINLDGGIYSLSGSATGLVLNANTVIESGEYSLTGTQANLDIARKSIIESGSYNLTGSDVTLIYTPGGVGESLFIDSGAFSLTGSDIGLKSTRLISVNSGSYNLTGQQISLTYNAKTIIDSGSYALIGSNVNLFANRVIIAISGSYTLSGTSVILKYSGDTYKTIGTVTAGFAQDRYSAEYKPTTITVNFKD